MKYELVSLYLKLSWNQYLGYTKRGNGYCLPSQSEGDLCEEKPFLVACLGANAGTNYYLDANCDRSCAQDRCNDDHFCVGYTKRSDNRYKLKSKITSTSSNDGYECWRKYDWITIIIFTIWWRKYHFILFISYAVLLLLL